MAPVNALNGVNGQPLDRVKYTSLLNEGSRDISYETAEHLLNVAHVDVLLLLRTATLTHVCERLAVLGVILNLVRRKTDNFIPVRFG